MKETSSLQDVGISPQGQLLRDSSFVWALEGERKRAEPRGREDMEKNSEQRRKGEGEMGRRREGEAADRERLASSQ